MTGWENFFLAEAGASAALVGLVFVGISINLAKIVGSPGLPGRAFEALFVLAVVLVVSSLLLVPGQSLMLIGAEVLVVGLIDWVTLVGLQISFLRVLDPRRRPQFVVRVILGQTATLPFIITGAVVLIQGSSGLYWIVPAVIFSLIVALLDAWVLVIEINR